MRSAWAALGIILLLVGVFLVLLASFSSYEKPDVVNWDKDPNPGDAFNARNVSRVLNQGDFFKVEIYAPSDWTEKMEYTRGAFYKVSLVNISDPSGAQTELYCEFLFMGSSSKPMLFYNITGTGGPNMTTVDAHGIDSVRFELPYGNNKPGIVARALSNGTYTANMTALQGGGSAPYEMKLSRGVIVTTKLDYTTTLLYPVGVGVFAVGVVLLVYGFGKPKKTVSKGRQTRTRSA